MIENNYPVKLTDNPITKKITYYLSIKKLCYVLVVYQLDGVINLRADISVHNR